MSRECLRVPIPRSLLVLRRAGEVESSSAVRRFVCVRHPWSGVLSSAQMAVWCRVNGERYRVWIQPAP